MNKTFLLILYTLVSFAGYSQEDGKGKIDAQRPTLTESYSIIIPNTIQFENGVDYFENSDKFSYGTFVRGSITNRVELRAFTDYQHLNTVGTKFIVMDPVSSALGIGASFIYNRDLRANSDDFRVALTREFNQIFATYNFGYNGFIYNILLIGAPLGDQVNYFAEYYTDPLMNRFHTGFTWVPKRDVQLDINGGWMDTHVWYGGIGVSFRLR
jgi:hypothetical protein